MRDNREKWSFFRHESRNVLTASDVVYWKDILSKLVKIGIEFEYNLPDKNGSCKGDNLACPCTRMADSECWKDCARSEMCKTAAHYRCGNKNDKCDIAKCSECEDYKLDCPGIFCVSFMGFCHICKDYQINCAGCNHKYDPNRHPESIRNSVGKELNPSRSYGKISQYGVHSITTDGSLLGNSGVEIITVGRRINFWEFFNMSKKVMDTCTERGAYLNERCSIHMHILSSYFGKIVNNSEKFSIPNQINELERPLPEIILANLHQLARRYQNALTWMSMGLENPEHMTRWEKFRVSVLDISGIMNKMKSVRDLVSKHSTSGSSREAKYGFVNYNNTQFNSAGDITTLHYEMRGLDSVNSPSVVAAMACLYYAMLIKAVEISRWGIVEVGDSEWLSKAKEVKKAMLNGMGGYDGGRFSDTTGLEKHYDFLISESFDLVHQMKHILIKTGPAYKILEKLAERPVSLYRCDGETWEDVENHFYVPMENIDRFKAAIDEFIDLGLIDECADMDEWVEEVSRAMKEDPELDIAPNTSIGNEVRSYVNDLRDEGDVIWSESLGTVISI